MALASVIAIRRLLIQVGSILVPIRAGLVGRGVGLVIIGQGLVLRRQRLLRVSGFPVRGVIPSPARPVAAITDACRAVLQ
ncbi:MAG TPA: hypothetical protein VKR24_12800 [Candidatus Limnocylindrales bacterium]|nr:hypothetical protein [Candidatus Limnocylindrales bacterium]